MSFLAPLLAGGAGAAGAAGTAAAAPTALGMAGQLALQPPQQQPMAPLFGQMQMQQPQGQGQDVQGLYNFFSSLSQPKQPTEQQAIQAKVGGFMPQ